MYLINWLSSWSAAYPRLFAGYLVDFSCLRLAVNIYPTQWQEWDGKSGTRFARLGITTDSYYIDMVGTPTGWEQNKMVDTIYIDHQQSWFFRGKRTNLNSIDLKQLGYEINRNTRVRYPICGITSSTFFCWIRSIRKALIFDSHTRSVRRIWELHGIPSRSLYVAQTTWLHAVRVSLWKCVSWHVKATICVSVTAWGHFTSFYPLFLPIMFWRAVNFMSH